MSALIPVIKIASRPTQPASIQAVRKIKGCGMISLTYVQTRELRTEISFMLLNFRNKNILTSIVRNDWNESRSKYTSVRTRKTGPQSLPLIPFYKHGRSVTRICVDFGFTHQLRKRLCRHCQKYSPLVFSPHSAIGTICRYPLFAQDGLGPA